MNLQLQAQACGGALDNTVTSWGHAGGVHASGIVYNWGLNMYGELGDGTTIYRSYSVEVRAGDYAGLHPGSIYLGDAAGDAVLQLSSADYVSGALMQSGVVYTWGGNTYRELGNTSITTNGIASTPIRVMKGAYPGTTYLGDASTNKIIQLYSGAVNFYAVAEDGMVYGWGSGNQGRLAQTSADQADKSIPVKILAGQYPGGYTYMGENPSNKVLKISAGYRGAMALTASGQVFMWGSNGVTGDGTTTTTTWTPVRVWKGAYPGTTYLGDNSANPIIAIAMGGSNGYAVDQSGGVYAWGTNQVGEKSNDRGQLGQNTTTGISSVPVRVKAGQYGQPGSTYLGDISTNRIVKIASADHNIMTLAQDGLVYAWGYNDVGQIGDGSNIDRPTPVKVWKAANYPGTTYLGDNSAFPIIAISGGANGPGTAFSLFLTDGDCRVYGTGNNSNGELGDGTTINRNSPVNIQVARACGARFGFGELGQSAGQALVMINGILYSWGKNTNGQLGNGTTASQLSPGRVLNGQYPGTAYLGDDQQAPANPILASAAGTNHTLAIAKLGGVYAFGLNSSGQLGNNATTQRTTPVRVLKGQYPGAQYLGDDTTMHRIIDMDAGSNSSFTLASDGLVYGWGNNTNGQLGDNSITNRLTPVIVQKGQYPGMVYLGDNGITMTMVSAGGAMTSALASNGLVYIWGLNTDGQLGNNSTIQRSTPVLVLKGQYPGTTYLGDNSANPIVSVWSAGSSMFAIDQTGIVYSWGQNSTGQLGDGTTIGRTTPIKVLKGQYGGTTYLGDNPADLITKIASGTGFTMGLGADGLVYAWGANASGQLGDGTTITRTTPIKMLKGAVYPGTTYLGDNTSARITDLAALNSTALFTTSDCNLYGIGDNSVGELGNGTTNNTSSPIKTNTPLVDFTLPIQLSLFEASQHASYVQLHWITASEVDCYAMEVERRVGESPVWNRVGNPLSAHGTSNISHDYRLMDDITALSQRSPVMLYYRVKVVNFDGSLEYSEIREVNLAPSDPQPELELLQNSPNPFGGQTSIVFTLPENGHAVLTVHDMTGSVLQTLVDETRPAGVYRQIMNAGNLAPGIYQYVLSIGSHRIVKKMLVVK